MTPRRILMTTDAVGGVWRYCVDLCRALNGAGTEVVLACLGPPPSGEQRAEVERLSGTRFVAVAAPLDWLAEGPDALRDIPSRIDEIAARHDVDLLHLNAPSQAAGISTRLPVLVVSHSCVVTWWAAMRGTPLPEHWTWQLVLNRAGMRRADVIVAPSSSHAALIAAAYGWTDRLQVVPNAGSTGLAGEPAAREPFVLAAARWWDEGKNGALLDLAAAHTCWPILAAGSCRGPNGQAFSFKRAHALGALPYVETLRRMRRAGVFVSPSLYEPFGLAALEAAQTGAPLLLSDIGTYREIWQDAAILVDPQDAPALAHAINFLSADAAERARLGRLARQRAEAFGPEVQLAALHAAYRMAAAAVVQLGHAG